jgi:hypothetical protein
MSATQATARFAGDGAQAASAAAQAARSRNQALTAAGRSTASAWAA